MATSFVSRRASRTRWRDTAFALVLTLGAIAFLVNLLVGERGLDFAYIETNYGKFLEAAQLTFTATTLSYFVGMPLGFFIGWGRTVRSVAVRKVLRDHAKAAVEEGKTGASAGVVAMVLFRSGVKHLLRRLADGYVEVIRGTPLFVQIVFAWSILIVFYPRLGQVTLIAGIGALTANTAGYQSEIFRAGLRTVQSGQVEASRALGLSRWGALRHVVLPQALRLVIPPLTNEYIGLLKSSSLLFVLGISELTTLGKKEAFISGQVFEVFALVTGIYLLITVPVSKVVEYLERRFRIPGLGIQSTTKLGLLRSHG